MYFVQIYCIKYWFAVLFTEKYSDYVPEMYYKNTSVISQSFYWNWTICTGIVRNERKCILCNLNVLEDEFHFVLQCTKYNDLSKKYIKKYYWSRPSNWFSYCQWKTGKKFIHLACKARNNLVWLTYMCVYYNSS